MSKRKRKIKSKQTRTNKPKPQNRKIFRNKSMVYIGLSISILIILVSIIIRIYSLSCPITGDEATYYALGYKAIAGYRPYLDFYEMKPPLLFYSYGMGKLIFGWSALGLRLLGFFLVLSNAFFLSLISKRFTNWTVTLLITGVYLFLSNNIYAFGPETVSEHFVIFYLLPGIFFLSGPVFKKKWVDILIAGFLICSGAMVKQTGALFGLGAVLFILFISFTKSELYQKNTLLKNLLFLASGALIAILFNLVPILVAGSFRDAIYWLVEFPSDYSSVVQFRDSIKYLETFSSRIIGYQIFTFSLLIISFIITFFSNRKSFGALLIIFSFISIIYIFPGFRYYGQYWLPLLAFLPLSLISLERFLKKRSVKHIPTVLALITLIFFSADIIRNSSSYFEKGYLRNSENARMGNYPSAFKHLVDDLDRRMGPEDSFIMLGTKVQSYVELEKPPIPKHIYPRLIGKSSPKNRQYQEEALNHIVNYNYDFIIYSVTGLGWASPRDFDDYLYQRTYNYTINNYEPILAFNYDDLQFYSADNGDFIDVSRPNQMISFKKK